MVIYVNEIFFLLFAFLTVFLSIKISYYADRISNNSGVNKALIGGIVLAGITSLPEFVTCFSAIIVGNPALAMGDVLGSNLFNIFMICFFDLIFIKKMIFLETSKDHNRVLIILIINYIFLLLSVGQILNYSIMSFGIPSIIIVLTYIYYIKNISRFSDSKIILKEETNTKRDVLLLILFSFFMIGSSILLTIIVNNLSIIYPKFSSSFLGAIFLGITTSLPEVVTFYTLICIRNYDLALSNILGSNLFNLLVLSTGDVLLSKPIYNYFDKDILFIILLGLLFIFFCFLSNNKKKYISFIRYSLLSGIVVLLYLSFWILKFII